MAWVRIMPTGPMQSCYTNARQREDGAASLSRIPAFAGMTVSKTFLESRDVGDPSAN